jgi:hypothetical protein
MNLKRFSADAIMIAVAYLTAGHTLETYQDLSIVNEPIAIATHPECSKIYVANEDSSLAILDIDKEKITKGFKITNELLGDLFFNKPVDLALDDIKRKLYVLNQDNQLTIFNLDSSGDVVVNAKILKNRDPLFAINDIFDFPKSMALDRRNNFLYVLNRSFISILNQNQYGDLSNIRTIVNPIYNTLSSIRFADNTFYMVVKDNEFNVMATDNIETLVNQRIIPQLSNLPYGGNLYINNHQMYYTQPGGNIHYLNETTQRNQILQLRGMTSKAVSIRQSYLYTLNFDSSIDIHSIIKPLGFSDIILNTYQHSFSRSMFFNKNIFNEPIKDIQIVTLPEHGMIYFNGDRIDNRRTISGNDIEKMYYVCPINAVGKRALIEYKISIDQDVWSHDVGTLILEKK